MATLKERHPAHQQPCEIPAMSKKFFRVAQEGQTTDGRVIERKWLHDIADTYDPRTTPRERRNCSPSSTPLRN
ncbi:Phage capsid scaffolding protein (GPO) serine peptidase [compost metagenome]